MGPVENTNVSLKPHLTISGGRTITVKIPSIYNKLVREYEMHGEDGIRKRLLGVLPMEMAHLALGELDFACATAIVMKIGVLESCLLQNIHFSEGSMPNLYISDCFFSFRAPQL